MATIIWKRTIRPALDCGNAKYRRHQRRKMAAIAREAIKNSVDRRGGESAKIAQAKSYTHVTGVTAVPLRKKPQESLYNRLMPNAWLFSIRETHRNKKALTASA